MSTKLGILRGAAHRGVGAALRALTKREWKRQKYERRNERPIEYAFVFEQLNRCSPETVLDVGTGLTALPSLIAHCGFVVTAIDNVSDYWVGEMYNRHFFVHDADIRRPKGVSGPFDFVTCVSVLEHIEDFDAAVAGMFSLLRPGGHLVITCPYNEREYLPNAYALPDASYGKDAPYVCQIYDRACVDRWLAKNGATLEVHERWQVFDGPYWTVGKMLRPPRRVGAGETHQLACMCFRKGAA